jgi:alcohol dehydrogenase class IV
MTVTPACALAAGPQEYLAPRQVLVGDGSSAQLGPALTRWGVTAGRVAVIADRAVAAAGVADQLLAGLAEAGFDPKVYADIDGEPQVSTAEAALGFTGRYAAGAVIGVGGGSAMDVAKIVALAAGNEGTITDYLGADRPARPGLPLALVPTTTGTGAEVTRISMLSQDGHKAISSNRLLVPTIAVLDADLVMGLPPAVTASTGMDALAHAVEAFLSTSRSALTVEASLRAIALLRDALPTAFRDGDDRHARRATLYGAHLAGLALNAGVVLGHSLAYTIANRRPLPHGVTCAIALPYCLAYNATADVPALDVLAETITGRPGTRLIDAARWIADLSRSLGIPAGLDDLQLPAGEAPAMAREVTERYPRPTNPVPIEAEPLARVVQAMHRGDVSAAWPVREEAS